MNATLPDARALFAAVVRLDPRRFRTAFGDERLDVFGQRLDHVVARHGPLAGVARPRARRAHCWRT